MLVEESRVVSGCPGLPRLDHLSWPVAGPVSSAYLNHIVTRISVNLVLTLPSAGCKRCTGQLGRPLGAFGPLSVQAMFTIVLVCAFFLRVEL
jgi:hypothetical protein